MEYFNEHSRKGEQIQDTIEIVLVGLKQYHGITYMRPAHDIARCFLNEICEFEAYKEENEFKHLTDKKEDLEKRVESYRGQLENALAYGFKQNQENVKLNQYIKKLERELKRRMHDEKNRPRADTEK